jgi:hypothetical protein
MSDFDAPVTEPVADGKGKTETKTWAATLAAFVLSLAGLTVLTSVDSDMIKSLPDWLETPAYSLLSAAIVYLTAFNTAHKPGQLSLSALKAARATRRV